MSASRTHRDMDMPYADNDGIRIHYHIEGAGPPLVFQHGFSGSLVDWYANSYVEPLKAGHELVLIDARGHGQSDKPHDPAAYNDIGAGVNDVVSALGER